MPSQGRSLSVREVKAEKDLPVSRGMNLRRGTYGMACPREITAVVLYDSTIQFHVASSYQYYVQSRVLVPRVRLDGISYGLGDMATTLSTGGM
jgi:hypothetical protein